MTGRKERLRATVFDSLDPRTIEVSGSRYCQTLRALIEAGDKGITALEMASWAFRLAHYIHILKKEHSLPISTEHEAHPGGFHGRYRLLCRVELLGNSEEVRAA